MFPLKFQQKADAVGQAGIPKQVQWPDTQALAVRVVPGNGAVCVSQLNMV